MASRRDGGAVGEDASSFARGTRAPAQLPLEHTWSSAIDAAGVVNAAERARARLAELEQRMEFLSGLEQSLTDLTRDPTERMEAYLNSPLMADEGRDDGADGLVQEEGNPGGRSPPRSPVRSPDKTTLPNAVHTDSEGEDDALSHASSRHTDPHKGKELFRRKLEDDHHQGKVEDMSVGDLRAIIREEVVDKAREMHILGGDLHALEVEGSTPGGKKGSGANSLRGEQDPHLAAPTDRLPRTLDEAVPIALPFVFKGLSRKSPLRLKCFMICKDETWSVIFLLALLASCAYIAIVPDDPELKNAAWSVFDTACNIIYGFEITCNIVAYGFIGRNAWFTISYFHKMEFLVLIATILEAIVAAFYSVEGLTVRPFRLLRIIPLMVTMRIFASVKIILDTLSLGASQLSTVLVVLGFFVCTFGIFIMQILIYSFRNRCVLDTRPINGTICASNSSTGWAKTCDFKDYAAAYPAEGGQIMFRGYGFAGAGYDESWCKVYCYTKEECKVWASYGRSPRSCQDDCLESHPVDKVNTVGVQLYPRDRWGRVHSCTMPNAYCASVGNPMFGQQHFDNIGGFVPATLQMAVPDSSYSIIHKALQSEPEVYPIIWTIVMLITVFCTWLMLGLFVAVVTGTFERARERYRVTRNVAGRAFMDESADHEKTTTVLNEEENFEDGSEDDLVGMQRTAKNILYESEFPIIMSLIVVGHVLAMVVQLEIPSFANSAKIIQYMAYIAYLIEMVLTVIACGGVVEYLNHGSNRIEALLVLLSIVSFFPNCEFIGFFCAIRLFRLIKYFETLYGLLRCAASSAQAIVNLVLFIAMLTFCFAITGRYLFGDSMNENTRSNFGSNGVAMLTIFQLMVGDSWSSVLYESVRVGSTASSQIFAAAFIIVWFVIAKLVVTNIFVAVIIENFQVVDTIESAGRPGYMHKIRSAVADSYKSYYALQVAYSDPDLQYDTDLGRYVTKKKLQYSLDADFADESEAEMHFRNVRNNPNLRALVIESVVQDSDQERIAMKGNEESERVLFCFGSHGIVKFLVQNLVQSRAFDAVVYIAILASSVILITTPPYDDIPDNPPWLPSSLRYQLEWAFMGIFTFEFSCRVLCDGLLFTNRAYLKDGWNCIDFTVLVFGWIDILQLLDKTSMVKVIRVMRGLKPLRMVKRLKGLRNLIDALFLTMLPVAYVLIFLMCICFVFSIVGMGMFSNKMYKCTDNVFAAYPGGKRDCVNFFTTDAGVLMPRAWQRPTHNFDNIYWAYLTLARLSTVKYVAILQDLQDITDVDLSPKREFSMGYSFFVVGYLIVGALFVMNLLVAFIVDGFNVNRNSSDQEIQYRRLLRYVSAYKPKSLAARPPTNEVSTWMRGVANGPGFNRLSTLCVLANTLILLSDHAEPNATWLATTKALELFFFAELTMEVVVNMIAYGIGGFLSDSWKVFDLFVVLVTSLGFAYSGASTVAVFVRASRAIRIVRLMRMISALRVILETMVSSIPQLMNIIGLFCLFIVIFAAVFMQMFATTRSGLRMDGGKTFGRTKTASFDTFTDSISILFQIVTGDEWHLLMDDNAIQYPECTPIFQKSNDPTNSMYYYQGPEYMWGDCGLMAAYLIFPLFVIFCQSVLLNLVIGMILDNFSFITDQVAEEEDPDWNGGAASSQIQRLADIFSAHAGAANLLPLWGVTALLRDMPEPVGFRPVKNPSVVVWGGRERTAEKLIRAQLNLRAKQRVRDWHVAHSSETSGFTIWVQRLIIKFFGSREKHHLEYIDFHEFILTAVCWRKPIMLPIYIKQERWRMFKEIILTFSGLIIKDALARNMALHLKKESNRALASLAEFTRWADNDEYWIRRIRFRRLRKLALEEKQNVSSMYRGIRETPPVATNEVTLEMVEEIPPGMIPHHHSLRWEGCNKFPRSIHGVQWFRKQAAVNKVVMRFVDIRNHSINLVVADFTQYHWEGWIHDGTDDEEDHLFRPQIKKERADLDDVDWTDVSFVMRPSAKAGGGRRRRDKTDDTQSKQRLVNMGSILDVQGCVKYSEMNAKNKPKDPTTLVRINLGQHPFDGLRERKDGGFLARSKRSLGRGVAVIGDAVRKMENRKIVAAHTHSRIKVLDGCLEVVGYMGNVSLGLQWQKVSREQALQGPQVVNPALAQALESNKLQFTRTEFAALRVTNLTWSSYVRVASVTDSDQFFSPAAGEGPKQQMHRRSDTETDVNG